MSCSHAVSAIEAVLWKGVRTEVVGWISTAVFESEDWNLGCCRAELVDSDRERYIALAAEEALRQKKRETLSFSSAYRIRSYSALFCTNLTTEVTGCGLVCWGKYYCAALCSWCSEWRWYKQILQSLHHLVKWALEPGCFWYSEVESKESSPISRAGSIFESSSSEGAHGLWLQKGL